MPENVEVVRSIGSVTRKVHTRKCGGCKKYWRCHKKSTHQKMWRLLEVLEVSQEKYMPENVEVVRSIGGVTRKVHTRKCGGCKKYQSQNAKRASSQKRHMVISIFLLCNSLILMSIGARSIRAIKGGLDKVFKIRDRLHRICRQILR